MSSRLLPFLAVGLLLVVVGSACGGCGNPSSTCAPLGSSCADGKVCCQGICGVDDTCKNDVVECGASATACRDNNDCCTFRCDNSTCSDQRCVDVGGACSSNTNCCTGTCTGGTCATVPGSTGTCKVVGQACSAGTDCCSTNCRGGFCAPQYTCKASFEVCYGDSDCCSKLCSTDDGSAGYCILPPGGCNQDGMPCSGGSTCCTRICADPGTGVTVCTESSGCVMTGLACIDNQACCGGGTNPNMSVTCEKLDSTDTYGRCDNGTACNPVGNICGAPFPLPDGGTFKVNASQDCCDGKKEVCKQDSAGIPRCFGGGSAQCPTGYTGQEPCCIQVGELCQFKDQCCGGAPCVPDATGVLRCSASTCTPLGATCTPSDAGTTCCSGQCIADELGATCRIVTTCKANGAACTNGNECCSLACVGGTCQVPGACQGSGQVCTSSADCCSGLSCVTAPGSTNGVCQTATTTCGQGGQACSPANPCCQGWACLQSGTVLNCDGTTACTCTSITIN